MSGIDGRSRGQILFALMLSTGLAALDATIVSTALPTIVSDLGGFSVFAWVFSLYLLTQTATIPIYGKLADILGRKPTILVGIVLFLTGSVLSGTSQSMTALIAFRGIQGLGAGGVLPIAMTIVGDLYTLEERGKIQGLLSSVWAIAAVLGPTLGGVLVAVSWRLIFFVNVPIAIVAIILLVSRLKESVPKAKATIDIPGSVLLAASVSALLLGILQGAAWGWSSAATLSLLIGAGVTMAVFVAWEIRAPSPMLPIRMLKIPIIGIGDLATLIAGGIVMGLSGYIPTFVQGVQGQPAIIAGLVLATMSIGWPLASSVSVKVLLRFGTRPTTIFGAALVAAGTGAILTITPATGVWAIAAMSFITGAGMGLVTTSVLVLIQEAVPWATRGAATGSNMFGRMLGSSIFVGVMGAVLDSSLASHLKGPSSGVIDTLLGAGRAHLPPAALQHAVSALAGSLHEVYLTAFLLAAALIAITFLLPSRESILAGREHQEPAATARPVEENP